MNLRQILLIVRLRWWLVLLILGLVVIGTAIVSVLLPKQYTAQTTLLLDVKTDPLVTTLMPSIAGPAYIATQTEIIRSDRVAARVVKMLGLGQSPAMVAEWRQETQGRIPLESYFGESLQRGLAVEPAKGSNLLNLSFTGTDPRFAAGVANAFAKAYLDLTVELRLEPARQYNSFYDDRSKALRTELEAAQKKLSDFREKKGIVGTDNQLDMESSKLAAILGQLASAQAELADTTTRQRNGGTETSPDVQQSGVVQGLKSQLASAQTRLSEISSIVGSNHPTRVQLEAQIAELKQQINSEMRRVSGTTATVNRSTGQKIAELAAMAETQKRNVLALRSERDELSVLQRDVETAQRAYEAVSSRRTQLASESIADQASARVLSLAVEPLTHSRPQILKNILVAAIVGLLLAVGAAMGVELLDRRVRSEADLLTDGIPLLGVISPKPGKVWHQQRTRAALTASGFNGGMPRLTHEGGVR
jgi:chain length determinant protein EpsF